MTAQRLALARKLGPDLAEGEKRIAKLGQDAADFGELIKRAEAEADRRDKDLLARASETLSKTKGTAPALELADPSRPAQLRPFDAADSTLHKPVTALAGVGSEPEGPPGNSSQALRLGALPGAVVVAPTDAQVIYAGIFHGYGPSLILRHGGGYHSVLAGLGRLDVAVGQWVLAGEPIGAMPDAAGDAPGGKLYIELRRDGRPVDPRPRLANVDGNAGRGERVGEQKVRE
jgi:septal ring factor EnvC (AmiA/AmiB activator)